MKSFGRILTAMVTPFHQDGTVNYEAAAKLAEHLIQNGSDGLVVAGSTGEAATMNKEEKLELFRVIVKKVGNKATIIAGTGSNDTLASVEMTRAAEKTGVHGVLLVGPYYNKPPQEGFYQHFKTIAQSISLPAVIYNVPGRTASNILPSTIIRLSEIDNIVAVKESSGQLEQFAEIIRGTSPDFMVYSGDDSLTLPSLAIGAQGIVSVAAHVAGNAMKRMIEAFLAGDIKTAAKLHLALLPVFKGLFITTNPIPVKTAVNLLGLNAGPFRLPLVNATEQETAKIQEVLQLIPAI
ncbi:4-hydroxy-tetrahydrodipicolinate synthase [Sporomusaceae bacterium BoRhaA]|uniref:4-hydroxy-tetrahydrodipicolinate synthase n=1 Tax=Pelorhabdus rhamnosifermentans TaxID=2772457 RepID=UPI001C06154F|nr:4-hydroxy-tetrahydrodipicolinate synthase [Pelorhabdus rhamnosifermentans]MBU2701943.1 4-hydroxy-tetrahydrodipicolinate synthase [Pelorhabdus rhamnosifermentans]